MSQSAAFNRFFADALAHAPGTIKSGVQAEMFATLRDFFQFTNIWQEDVDVYVSQASAVYSLLVSSGKSINRLMNLWDTAGDVNRKPWVWPATMATPGTLTLLQPVTSVTQLHWSATVALFALDPLDADGNPIFPSWILDKHFDTLFAGVLFRLMKQPAKPYSNLGMAKFHYQTYAAGRGRARTEVERANTYSAQNWNFPRAFVGPGGNIRQRGV